MILLPTTDETFFSPVTDFGTWAMSTDPIKLFFPRIYLSHGFFTHCLQCCTKQQFRLEDVSLYEHLLNFLSY